MPTVNITAFGEAVYIPEKIYADFFINAWQFNFPVYYLESVNH
jgi:hypothetical protein